jgi:hypothetical protein
MGRHDCPTNLNAMNMVTRGSDECAPLPISFSGVDDLRRLMLRTLNDNQLLLLNAIAERNQSLTSLLKQLSEEYGVPLSTLKLNARILRELNMITYGSVHERREAKLKEFGRFVRRVVTEQTGSGVTYLSD